MMKLYLLGLASLSISWAALAQQPFSSQGQRSPPMGMGQRQGPPPEAFTACNNLSAEDVCSVQTPHGTLTGTCAAPRGEQQLVCTPKEHGRKTRRPEQGGMALRRHTAVQIENPPKLRTADIAPIAKSIASAKENSNWRVLKSNGISVHDTGAFPNDGNPNRIREQGYNYRVPAFPRIAARITPAGHNFGIAVNGVPFDPGAAEFYQGDPSSGWQYEALSGAVELGFDAHHAHVQPTGAYHYHGLPTGLLDNQKLTSDKHSPLIGWAADGFPIYALYGYKDVKSASSGVAELTSSYQLKSGARPSGAGAPGGTYDGTFVADYEYIAGTGTLDKCNGRITATPEFPKGIYAYFLTQEFPVIPRCYKGTPPDDFTAQGPRPNHRHRR